MTPEERDRKIKEIEKEIRLKEFQKAQIEDRLKKLSDPKLPLMLASMDKSVEITSHLMDFMRHELDKNGGDILAYFMALYKHMLDIRRTWQNAQHTSDRDMDRMEHAVRDLLVDQVNATIDSITKDLDKK